MEFVAATVSIRIQPWFHHLDRCGHAYFHQLGGPRLTVISPIRKTVDLTVVDHVGKWDGTRRHCSLLFKIERVGVHLDMFDHSCFHQHGGPMRVGLM